MLPEGVIFEFESAEEYIEYGVGSEVCIVLYMCCLFEGNADARLMLKILFQSGENCTV